MRRAASTKDDRPAHPRIAADRQLLGRKQTELVDSISHTDSRSSPTAGCHAKVASTADLRCGTVDRAPRWDRPSEIRLVSAISTVSPASEFVPCKLASGCEETTGPLRGPGTKDAIPPGPEEPGVPCKSRLKSSRRSRGSGHVCTRPLAALV